MEIRLLGPLEVRDGGVTFTLPRRQQRALLAALALRAGETVSTDRLVADLWGERAPASAIGSLQNAVSALRKVLGEGVLVRQAPGYRLLVRPDDVDATRFERLVSEARSAEPAGRAALLSDALALWRGPALADLDELEFARLEAARLDELYVNALEERLEADLELGRHGALVGELETLVATHPLRERLRGQLMLALYRCGRQAEALEVYRAARLALADELGLDPTPELQELERRILRQDPALAAPVPPVPDTPPAQTERQLVSVLVAVPPAEEDPERLRQRLDEVLAAARGTLQRHRGELVRFGPEGLVAVFGAERASDDDAVRATAAAQELGLPAGVATGESVGGAGSVFVRAAELARGTGVQLDARTHELVHAVRRHDAPLVGRSEELGRLEDALATAHVERRCHVVTVVGEPGIGKSRLARELVRQRRGDVELLVGRCVSFGDGATFAPLQSAMRDADAEEALEHEPEASLVLERLAALAEGSDAVSLGEAYWAVRRLLEALAGRRPVLFVLDDVHWAEPGLLDLVDYLTDRVDAPLLVLCLARPELARTPGAKIVLDP
ncbi:MAG TPA: BTAD domain-containing putative transcriptional regulator, partial [Solirubrobacteraceae bacterium]|nr:BTAD domain-containing putative transcriptional regulator [Solirubrobacteraceae bacterium]